MTDTALPQPATGPAPELPSAEKSEKKEGSFIWFLVKLAIFVLILRSFIFAPFSIPSESMLPRLENGDHLIASKWNYGFTSNSLPLSAPLIPGRLFASQPEPGDVVIFKHPIDQEDYIKRVIGLPGDQIQVIGGVVHINGKPVEKKRVEDFTIPLSPNTDCAVGGIPEKTAEGVEICRYMRFKETLPNGVTYYVLDFGSYLQDDTQAVIVPEGHMFVMGDNRDNSLDSRFPAMPGKGVGIVSQDLLVGKAQFMMWSTDGSAEWIKPWTWFSAARWERIGGAI